jgi:hypothetical protein
MSRHVRPCGFVRCRYRLGARAEWSDCDGRRWIGDTDKSGNAENTDKTGGYLVGLRLITRSSKSG